MSVMDYITKLLTYAMFSDSELSENDTSSGITTSVTASATKMAVTSAAAAAAAKNERRQEVATQLKELQRELK